MIEENVFYLSEGVVAESVVVIKKLLQMQVQYPSTWTQC